MLKEIIWLLLIVLFAIVWFIFAILIISYERTSRIKKLKKNLSYFNPQRLSNRLDGFLIEGDSDENDSIIQLSKRVSELKKRDYIKINTLIDSLNKLSLPTRAFNFKTFSKNYKNVIEFIQIYEEKYLDVRFTLFDLTSDVEIEKEILNQLRIKVSTVSNKILNSPNKKISESKKMNSKINLLRKNLTKLEKLISFESKKLSMEFINLGEKIDLDILTLNEEVDFANNTYKHMKEDLNVPLKSIVESYNNNIKILEELKPQIQEYTSSIKNLKQTITKEMEELKVKKVSQGISKLDDLVSELNLLINSNIDYAKFNFEFDHIPSMLLKYIKRNHSLYISEIKRHKLGNEQRRLVLIVDAYDLFESAVKKYENEKTNRIIKHSPSRIHKLLMDTVNTYEYYVRTVSLNVKDISAVNSSTNIINRKIAKMNTLLLQIEHNIKPLGGITRDQFENEKNNIQVKVTKLRNSFKNNLKVVDDDSFVETEKIMAIVEDLTLRTRGAAFEHYFLKETIMYLNRFKGANPKFDILLDSVQDSFSDEKYSESLRRYKELIEIYGIK